MPTDGYMDAAAVPVPGAGDDTLRDEVQRITADVIYRIHGPDSTDRESAEQDADDIRDALLPLIREHTAAAVQAERERVYTIADENLADLRDEYGKREQSQDQIRERLTDERDQARAALARVREAIAEHRSSKGPAATVQVYRLDAALDGAEATHDR